MGYRKITEIEFKYIKELFKKYKSKAKVSSIAGRSPSTVSYIKEAKDYAEYVEIRPGGAKHGKNKKAKPTTKKSNGDIDTAILKELTALRKAIFKLNGTMEKLISASMHSLIVNNVEKITDSKNKPYGGAKGESVFVESSKPANK